jgi:hypothetical protein
MSTAKPHEKWCSFCGRERGECRGLAVGTNVSICDRCAVEAVKKTAPRVGSKEGGYVALQRLI